MGYFIDERADERQREALQASFGGGRSSKHFRFDWSGPNEA